MRARYAGMMNNEMENKWDDRFNELRCFHTRILKIIRKLRRSHDPVKESFFDLQCVPLRRTNVAVSLIQFEASSFSYYCCSASAIEAHVDALRMSLSTLDEIMAIEHQQVETWKEQRNDAHFLIDYGVRQFTSISTARFLRVLFLLILTMSNCQRSLEEILSCIIRVRREIEMVVDGIEANRDNVEELDHIFGLYYLENSMREVENAVDSIPTVYELKKKYGNGM